MLIGGDNISNDIIILGTCFPMFAYIHAHFHFALIGRNLKASSQQRATGELELEWIQTPEVYIVGYGWLQARTPQSLLAGSSPYSWVWVWVEVTLWLWSANVNCTYKLITKLTHLHTQIFLHFSIPVVMCTFLLAWGFSSFSPHPYLNITLANISCYFFIQVIKCLTFKKWSKVLC